MNETHSWLGDVIWVWIMGIVTDTPLYISPPTRRRGESWRQCLSIAWIKTRQCGLEWGLPKLSGCPKFGGFFKIFAGYSLNYESEIGQMDLIDL